MERMLGKFSPQIYALLRIVAGFLFACHGAQKLFGVLGGFGGEPDNTAALFSMMGLAGVIEFGGGVFIMLGFFTGWVAFVCSGQMAAAYFMAHAGNTLFPIQNRGELSMLYAFLFLFMAARGSGYGASMPCGELQTNRERRQLRTPPRIDASSVKRRCCTALAGERNPGDVLRSLSKKKMYGSPNSNPSPELGADKENHTSWERYYQVSDCSSSLRNDWYSGI